MQSHLGSLTHYLARRRRTRPRHRWDMGDQSEVQVKQGYPRTDQPEEQFHPLPRVQPHEPLDTARLSSVLLRD